MIKHLFFCCAVLGLIAMPAKAQDSGWKQLFNGKNLDGWEHVGPGGFTLVDGLLKSHGGMGLLWYTGQKFGNCKIRVVYKMRDQNDNSGVFIRIPIKPREAWMPVNYGYEVQVDDNPEGETKEYHSTGCLYSISKALAYPGKGSGQWNTMVITLDGPRTIVDVNGVKVTDYKEGESAPPRKFGFEPERGPRPNEGYIGVQNHSDKDIVFFKEVAVRSLK
jgi:3-keto-disaccharide hydrolase